MDDILRTNSAMERSSSDVKIDAALATSLLPNYDHQKWKMYKYLMADKSQVCDGRSMETLRRNADHDMCGDFTESKQPTNHSGSSSVNGKLDFYKPVRAASRSKGNPPRLQQEPQEQDHSERSRISSNDSPSLSSLSLLEQTCLSDSIDTSDSIIPRTKSNQDKSKHRSMSDPPLISNPSIPRVEDDDNAIQPGPSLSRRSSSQWRRSSDSDSSSSNKVALRKKYEPRHRCPDFNQMVTGIVKPSRYTKSRDAGQSHTSLANLAGAISTAASSCVASSTTSPTANSNSATDDSNNKRVKIAKPRGRVQRGNSLPASLRPAQLSGSLSQLKPSEINKLKNYLVDTSCSFSEEEEEEENNVGASVSTSKFNNSANNIWDISRHNNDDYNQSWVANGVDFSASMEVYLFEK